MATEWTAEDMPDQSGRIIVITGATSGLGLASAQALAAKGAELVLAVRDAARGGQLAERLRTAHPAAKVTVSPLDLANLSSVRDCAARLAELPRIDVLMNNAGLGMQPTRAETADGFERQFGTNHLGHFVLTALLVPVLLRAPAPRVVVLASNAHRRARIQWDDLQSQRQYSGTGAYGQSKLANLMFALELAARAREQGSPLASIAAHPGLSDTGFMVATKLPGWMQLTGRTAIRVFGQDAVSGARPQLYAATMPDAVNGDYWGPDGFMEFRGPVHRSTPARPAADRADWQRLWAVSETLTGTHFPSLV